MRDIPLWALILNLLLTGCRHEETINPPDFPARADKSITVFLKDKTRILFKKGEYRVADSLENRFITGEGRILPTGLVDRQGYFRGSVNFSDIEKIESSENSAVTLIGLGFIVIIMGVLLGEKLHVRAD